MSDNETSEDREHPASQRRLDKAAEQGRLARSRDLVHWAGFTAAIGFFSFAGTHAVATLINGLRSGLTISPKLAQDATLLAERLTSVTGALFVAVAPLLVLLAVISALAAMLPGGPAWTMTPLQIDFNRLSPARALGRIASLATLGEFAKLLFIVVVLITVGAVYVHSSAPKILALTEVELPAAMAIVGESMRTVAWLLSLVLLLATVADVPLQWFRLQRELRMSRSEVREEQKETDGDPQIKARIRSMQMQMRSKQMLAAVPKADVIVTNPTHYAVAIRYDEHGAGAPIVLAKGIDHLATKIREVGAGCGIPLVEAAPLARALYRHVDVDQQIPATLYQAVAQVLAYVYQLRQWQGGKGRRPPSLQTIEIPRGLDPLEASS